ncbi:MAG TPA: dienelactone hydrolase family protein [Candidatus Eisenbacteria bacterium]|nr:dienelactone hydrolase family protein [Candidatus Eisenbacteria bacterium]
MTTSTSSEIDAERVHFGPGIGAVRALPKARERRPAVIILHERYGIDRHTQDLTVKLAEAGWVGLAPDLFHRFTGDRQALGKGQLRVELRDDEALHDLNAAIAYLTSLDTVDRSRLGIIGVCQTGRQPLLLAAHRNDLSGAVVLYGAIGGKEWLANDLRPTPVEALIGQVSCPVLGVFGEADHIISIDDVFRFRNCLEQSRKTYHVRLYPDAPHGWLNDTMPGRYREESARDAWSLIVSFLEKSFARGWDGERVVQTFECSYSKRYDFAKNVRLE